VLPFAAMKCVPCALALLALATSCGTSSHAGVSSPPLQSVAGSWSVELTQNATTQSLFQTTLVSQAVVSSACSISTQTGTISVQALDLTGCYIADRMTNQGSFTSAGTYTPQAVLVETLENSSDINVIVVETDPAGSLFVFSGNGTAVNSTMTGNWMCNTGWSSSGQYGSVCAGWSGTFSGTQQD
jgi:hypothetical protein